MIEYDACGPIWDGAGLLHVITSYLDGINISFNADAELLPDPDTYRHLVQESLDELLTSSRSAGDRGIISKP
jgi:hypothetical protein